jgi:hypothetical protein
MSLMVLTAWVVAWVAGDAMAVDHRADAAAIHASAAAARIDDFEDGDLIAATGSAWIPLCDDLIGGKTAMRLQPMVGGAHGSRGSLRLAGTIGDGPNAFAGVWTAVAPGSRAADLSRLEGLRLSIRGNGDVLVGVRRGSGAVSLNFMVQVTASGEWKDLDIPFTRLRPQGKVHENDPWDPHEAYWLGVSSVPGARGPFTIDIDAVAWIARPGSAAAAPAVESGAPPLTRHLDPDEAGPLRKLTWRELARDGEGDGKPGLPDARMLFAAVDASRPLVWFRIDLRDDVPPDWIGVNLVLDSDGDPLNGTAWWGQNAAFHFDRLVTAWVWRVGKGYEGTVGIASGEEVAAMRLTNDQELHLAIDRDVRRVYLGVPRAGIAGAATRAVAAVGSAMFHSDDLPDQSAVDLGGLIRNGRP